ncbi:hypothetical protein FA95DRAFT_297072 [Auriscalpium vulgare]|uniref:Uncharacterized protein n=1 Tax=Auriscalpium vulgare TaxID=40419 RepID=A0ACB8RKS6_9AGAM|nr:hypothetical protein FA95DRAFT_297072 [Auriscalpium vulgare]
MLSTLTNIILVLIYSIIGYVLPLVIVFFVDIWVAGTLVLRRASQTMQLQSFISTYSTMEHLFVPGFVRTTSRSMARVLRQLTAHIVSTATIALQCLDEYALNALDAADQLAFAIYTIGSDPLVHACAWLLLGSIISSLEVTFDLYLDYLEFHALQPASLVDSTDADASCSTTLDSDLSGSTAIASDLDPTFAASSPKSRLGDHADYHKSFNDEDSELLARLRDSKLPKEVRSDVFRPELKSALNPLATTFTPLALMNPNVLCVKYGFSLEAAVESSKIVGKKTVLNPLAAPFCPRVLVATKTTTKATLNPLAPAFNPAGSVKVPARKEVTSASKSGLDAAIYTPRPASVFPTGGLDLSSTKSSLNASALAFVPAVALTVSKKPFTFNANAPKFTPRFVNVAPTTPSFDSASDPLPALSSMSDILAALPPVPPFPSSHSFNLFPLPTPPSPTPISSSVSFSSPHTPSAALLSLRSSATCPTLIPCVWGETDSDSETSVTDTLVDAEERWEKVELLLRGEQMCL